jgi:transcription elongation factor SPT6
VDRRDELVGDAEKSLFPVVGPRVWNNCASFLYIPYDSSEPSSEYLDNTRVHPEDYELGRKMAADALELDEEDIKAEIDEYGAGAIVRKLIKDEAQEKVNDLVLEEYAEQLEENFNQRKRATLETIRAELQVAYEELRNPYNRLTSNEIFTMLTGETKATLAEKMVVSVNIRRLGERDSTMLVKLDCGVQGTIPYIQLDMPGGESGVAQYYSVNQTIQAKIVSLNRQVFTAELSNIKADLEVPYNADIYRSPDSWDAREEAKDREALKESIAGTGRTQRVVKHPLFRTFNSAQAEEYLGAMNRGDAVIRPSSKGNDHLAVTWKVADNVYQHVDVLELDKENEFTVGRTLKAGNATYSDLDELIVMHIKAMAKKVDEITGHEKYQANGKTATGSSPHFFLAAMSLTNMQNHRAMAENLHGGQPAPVRVRFLYQSQEPGLFLSVLQSRAESELRRLACENCPQCLPDAA